MKKILFYINTLGRGGAERVISNLAGALAADGFKSVLVTSYPTENEYKVCGSVRRVTLFDRAPKGKIIKNIKMIKALKNVVKEERPDIAVAFTPEPNFRLICACRGANTKVFVSVRNDPAREYKNRLYAFLAKTLYKRADGVIFQTEDAKAWFPKAIREKSKVILNQVGDIFFETPLADVRKNVVSVGRFVPQKDHELLICAFKSIADKISDDLIFYGDGPLRGKYEETIGELDLNGRANLAGKTENVAEKLSKAKLFVLSSDYEGMPNALLEAMAMGLPCVSTDCPCGGPKAIIEDGKDGLLVPVGDEKALADAMEKVLLNEEFASALGKNAREKAKRLFAPDVIFNEWKSFLFGDEKPEESGDKR